MTGLLLIVKTGVSRHSRSPNSSGASLPRPFAYLTHGGAELREVRALPDLNHPVAELRLLLAPVKQVHVPAAVASAALSRPHRRPAAAACRCHIGGEEKKTAAPAPNAAALRGPRFRLRAAPSAPVPGAARGLHPGALQPHPPRRWQNRGKREDHPGTDSNKLLPVHTSLPRPPLAGWRVRSP